MIVLGVKNGGAGLKGVAGKGDSGHPTSNERIPLKEDDMGGGRRRVGRGIETEEVR